MARHILRFVGGVALFALLVPISRSDDDAGLQSGLAVQRALEQAQHQLIQGDAKKAVEILEENLPRANGNARFLKILRDAYRTYIRDLWVANQGDLALRYLDRLTVLEPEAASDPTLRPPSPDQLKTPTPPVVAAPPKKALPFLPDFKLANPFAKFRDSSAEPTTIRGKVDNPAAPSPPLATEQPVTETKVQSPQQCLQRAEDEFNKRHFSVAVSLYEQAAKNDVSALVVRDKERWAYCVLDGVVEQLKQSDLKQDKLVVMRRDVESALSLAPSLNDSGHWLLNEIDERGKGRAPGGLQIAPPEVASIPLRHLGKNPQGWNVVETDHFMIFHNQSQEEAERLARIVEQTRETMQKKWFGDENDIWQTKCELIFHASGAEYTRATGVPSQSPGHSRIESDPTGKRVVSRRMDLRCDIPGTPEAVLPHETTHVVLAGRFGGFPVPRWADEGIAVLSEPSDKIEQHHHNLILAKQEGVLFTAKELLTLSDYPSPRRISAFYAQSVALVEFLALQKGPREVTQFIRDGLRDGYDASLRRHFNMDMTQLQDRWTAYMFPASTVASGR